MNNKKSYVYKITCKITGEFYFGSSFNAKSDRYWGSGRRIKERISMYGKENFVKEIIGEFDDRVEAHKVENQYIKKFIHDDKCLNKMLNRHFGAYSNESRAKIGAANAISQRGKHYTDETIAKMSAAKRGEKNNNFGKHHTEEARAKISAAKRGEKNPMYGKHLSDEHRAKISAAKRGKHRTDEFRAKMSVAHRGRHWRKNPVTGKREWYD